MSHTSCTVESAWLLWCQACCNICFCHLHPLKVTASWTERESQDSAVLSPLTCNALLQSPNGCCCFGKDQHLTMFAGFSLQAELLAFVSIAYQQTTCTGMACSCCTPTAIDAVPMQCLLFVPLLVLHCCIYSMSLSFLLMTVFTRS